jgi:hypothetical protein
MNEPHKKGVANHLDLEAELVENVPPIQLAMRLLIPAGSRLLDQLCSEIQLLIQREERLKSSRRAMFAKNLETGARQCASGGVPSPSARYDSVSE